jgi:dienelactone hydrolase
VVLQYTTPLLRIIPDSSELPLLGQLLGWVEASRQDDAHFLGGAVDLSQLCVAGHSRGAKLAALHYAANRDVVAAVLIDPVNNTKYTAESAEYPDACKALQAAARPVGIVGRCPDPFIGCAAACTTVPHFG